MMVDKDNGKLRASRIYHRDQQNREPLEIAVIVSKISNVIGRFLKIIQNYWLIFIAMYIIHTPTQKLGTLRVLLFAEFTFQTS